MAELSKDREKELKRALDQLRPRRKVIPKLRAGTVDNGRALTAEPPEGRHA